MMANKFQAELKLRQLSYVGNKSELKNRLCVAILRPERGQSADDVRAALKAEKEERAVLKAARRAQLDDRVEAITAEKLRLEKR